MKVKNTQKTVAVTSAPELKLYMFIVWGKDREPERVLMNQTRKEFFDDKCRIAANVTRDGEQVRARVYSDIFGTGAEFAVLCSKESMAQLATGYPKDAPHAQKLKYMAACVAMGKVHGAGQDGKGPEGGQKAPIDPVKPKPTRPNGGAAVKTRQPVAATV
jgi:hypothetical protein